MKYEGYHTVVYHNLIRVRTYPKVLNIQDTSSRKSIKNKVRVEALIDCMREMFGPNKGIKCVYKSIFYYVEVTRF